MEDFTFNPDSSDTETDTDAYLYKTTTKRGERKSAPTKSSKKSKKKKTQTNFGVNEEQSEAARSNASSGGGDSSGKNVATFDYSVENHMKWIYMVSKLCGVDIDGFDEDELDRLASSITFLREWRYFNYKPRVVHFLPGKGQPSGTEAHNEITLSQFSSAVVPKCDIDEKGPAISSDPSKDFILYAGGLVWALDWCPREEQGANFHTQCEFIAVAAHPPDSTYHKLGAPLSGRGMIQVWCLLNCTTKEDLQPTFGSAKQNSRKNAVAEKGENKPVRPRGRPRKNAIEKNHVEVPQSEIIQALVQHSEDILDWPPAEEGMGNACASMNTLVPVGDPDQCQISNTEKEEIKCQKSRGRPRMSALDKTPADISEGQFIPALAVQLPALDMPPVDGSTLSNPVLPKEKRKRRKTGVNIEDKSFDILDAGGLSLEAVSVEFPQCTTNISSAGETLLNTAAPEMDKMQTVSTNIGIEDDLECTIAGLKRKSRKKSKIRSEFGHDNRRLLKENEGERPLLESPKGNLLVDSNILSERHLLGNHLSHMGLSDCHNLRETVLPRVVLCLGHDGKVAWDVKWRPIVGEVGDKHRMGYLAVVLGNGSVEVWEVPSPQVINCIYASHCGKDTDPRFAKLKPVFRSSMLMYGDRQSMPLTVDWSASPPHDLLLAGCHDGVVALWKFSTEGSCEDVRPLLCFSADTGPIRALTWAPFDGDTESSNVIVTAGHGGLKFWDLRDPFRPLWDANPSQRFVYGLDWLPDPRCIIVTYDDGTLKILSLSKAAFDAPVTGEPFSGTQFQGLHSLSCSSSAIWSIHVSRSTGVVAYCGADGTVRFFQLTHKAVEKDFHRNRSPHFLCGYVAGEESAVAVNSEFPGSPHQMKSAAEWATPLRSTNHNSGKRIRKGTEKSPNPGEQVLALCYGDDAENVLTKEAEKSAKGGRARTSKTKKTTDDQGLGYGTGKGTFSGAKQDGEKADGEVEVPPKIASMYRVRWNMNKGSERWLCYGGAGGIVRCQEITVPETDKKPKR